MNLTKIYFVRHAQPDYSHHDESRPLTEKGQRDAKKLVETFEKLKIDFMLSSPYKRSYDTITHIAEAKGLEIEVVDDFRERAIDSGWIEDFASFSKRQWADFEYKLPEGECLKEVQERNIRALKKTLQEKMGSTMIIGSHGTALSMIINYYDKSFNFDDFDRIRNVMPWIVEFTFDGDDFQSYEYMNF